MNIVLTRINSLEFHPTLRENGNPEVSGYENIQIPVHYFPKRYFRIYKIYPKI